MLKSKYIAVFHILVLLQSAIYAQVIETSQGKVEFIGLEEWTLEKLQEKLGYDSPDNFHFCAADLKVKLGFAETSVITGRENDKKYTVISVIEPKQADVINYRPIPTTSVPIPEGWGILVQLVEQKKVLNGFLDYGSALKDAIKLDETIISDEDTSWWAILQQLNTEKDFNSAIQVLTEDKSFYNRVAAAMVLTNFAGKDSAWLRLIGGVRDENFFVNMTCTQALVTMTSYVPRAINWSSATTDIHHILNGTNLFALPQIINTLVETKVSPELAKPILNDNGGNMLLKYLKAEHKREKTLAHALLLQLSGKDYGFDEKLWANWIENID